MRLRIYEGIKKLSDFPEISPIIPEEDAPGAQRGYRRIVINPYIIFYRVLVDRIVIARILHGRQNWLQSIFYYPRCIIRGVLIPINLRKTKCTTVIMQSSPANYRCPMASTTKAKTWSSVSWRWISAAVYKINLLCASSEQGQRPFHPFTAGSGPVLVKHRLIAKVRHGVKIEVNDTAIIET